MSFSRNAGVAIVLLAGIMCGPLAMVSWAASADELEAPRVDRAHARRAHRLVEEWVRRGAVPDAPEDEVLVAGLSGVRVTLWRGGVSHGVGEAYPVDLAAVTDPSGATIDLVSLLAEATNEALAGVQETLDEAELRARMEGLDLEELEQTPTLLTVADELLVSVQVAGPLETIRLARDAETAELYHHLAPGYHGLRVTSGEDARRTALLWPAMAVERNMSPRGQLTHLLAATGHDVQAIARLARRDGPRLARFETYHVVRPKRGWPAVDLVRGAVLLPRQQIDEATLDDVATRLARHLERRFTGEGVVRGTYLPTRNAFDPAVADPGEAALAVYAVTRHAAYLHAMGDEGPAGERLAAAEFALARLGEWVLAGAEHAPRADAASTTAALILLSLIDAPTRTGEQREMRDQLGQWLVDRVTGGAGDAEAAAADDREQGEGEGEGDAEPLPVAVQALHLAALSALYEQRRDAAMGEIVTEQMLRLTQAQPDVASLWWWAMAHHRVAPLLIDEQTPVHEVTGQRLVQLGQTLLRRQVTGMPALGPADVVGGFQLGPIEQDAPPAVDWRTSHVLAFQAIALRDPNLLEGERGLDWLLSAGLAARFLAQLVVDEPAAYSMRSPADALGGVRLAPWDNRLTVSTQAMTLLAITELQHTLEELTRRGM